MPLLKSMHASKRSPPAVLWASWLNRGTNFGREEREQLHIEGLLPPVVESLELQVNTILFQSKGKGACANTAVCTCCYRYGPRRCTVGATASITGPAAAVVPAKCNPPGLTLTSPAARILNAPPQPQAERVTSPPQ